VFAVAAAGLVMFRDRLSANGTSSGYEFVADVDNWQRTDHERAVDARFDFDLKADLKQIPLKLGDWQGEDVPQTNVEVFILLEPEQYVQRMYRLPDGRFVWLSLIGSRKSKSFHSPQICYDTDGWKTEASSEAIALDQGEVYALRLVAQKVVEGGTVDHIITYFYLWPSYQRNAQDGMVLVKLTAPLYGTVDETVELEKQFFRELFTSARS
jgi:EpsI family protein